MPTRGQVTELLDGGDSFERAGRALGIAPGQAYMIASGRAADGSSQQLINPPVVNPAREQTIRAWVRERAARELTQGAQ